MFLTVLALWIQGALAAGAATVDLSAFPQSIRARMAILLSAPSDLKPDRLKEIASIRDSLRQERVRILREASPIKTTVAAERARMTVFETYSFLGEVDLSPDAALKCEEVESRMLSLIGQSQPSEYEPALTVSREIAKRVCDP